MTSCFIGIDPGLDGGIAAIIDGAPMPVIFEMPTTSTPVKRRRQGRTVDGIDRDLDGTKLTVLLETLRGEATDVYVLVERAQLRPATGEHAQGVVSQAKFYGQYREIIGILKALKIPFEDVHPATWKADVFRGASDKTDARMKASQLYPAVASRFQLKKNDGLAESLLLADYGKRRRGAAF